MLIYGGKGTHSQNGGFTALGRFWTWLTGESYVAEVVFDEGDLLACKIPGTMLACRIPDTFNVTLRG